MDHLVDKSRTPSATGVQPTATENDVQRTLEADEARQALRAATGGQDAQVYLRLSERHTRGVGCDAEVARQRQLEPAAERGTADRRDSRAGQPGQLVAHRLKTPTGMLDVSCSWRLAKHFQVGAGHELAGLGTRDDQTAHV